MRKQPEIKTVSYVHVGDKLVNTDDLDPELKERLGIWLKLKWYGEIYRGQARFWPLEGGSST